VTGPARSRSARPSAMLLEAGLELGRPLADRVRHSRLSNLKELRPGSAGRSEIRILYLRSPAEHGPAGSRR
jgi:hypothetical protein